MSHFREDTLTAIQEDLTWPLLADEYFADINVFDFHKKDLATAIQNSIGVLAATGGKVGACVVAMPLSASDDMRDASPAHPLSLRITYRVCVDPVINGGANGTGKPALSICSRLHHILKHHILGGYASGLVPDGENFIVPVEDGIAPVCYDVNFVTRDMVDQNFVKCAMPGYSYDKETGILTLTCETPDATIYYTTDGSYPFTSARAVNAGATVYTTPITIEGEVLVRAAAYKEVHIGSHVWAARFNVIGDSTAELHATS